MHGLAADGPTDSNQATVYVTYFAVIHWLAWGVQLAAPRSNTHCHTHPIFNGAEQSLLRLASDTCADQIPNSASTRRRSWRGPEPNKGDKSWSAGDDISKPPPASQPAKQPANTPVSQPTPPNGDCRNCLATMDTRSQRWLPDNAERDG